MVFVQLLLNKKASIYYVGLCPLGHTENNTDRVLSDMPSDPNIMNDTMCDPYNPYSLY